MSNKTTLAKIPDEFLKGQIMQDAKRKMRSLTNKSNITNTSAMRFIAESYSFSKRSIAGEKKRE